MWARANGGGTANEDIKETEKRGGRNLIGEMDRCRVVRSKSSPAPYISNISVKGKNSVKGTYQARSHASPLPMQSILHLLDYNRELNSASPVESGNGPNWVYLMLVCGFGGVCGLGTPVVSYAPRPILNAKISLVIIKAFVMLGRRVSLSIARERKKGKKAEGLDDVK